MASPRDFAPEINTDKFCFNASCPIKSDKARGRMVAAISSGIFGSKKRSVLFCIFITTVYYRHFRALRMPLNHYTSGAGRRAGNNVRPHF